MEEDNTQREDPKQEGADEVHVGKNSRCAFHWWRFSVNIYQCLLSAIPAGNDLAFSSVNARSAVSTRKIAGGQQSLSRAPVMCLLTSLRTG